MALVVPGAVAELEVDDRESRRFSLNGGEAFGDADGDPRREAARPHGPRQSLAKGSIVVDDQQFGFHSRFGVVIASRQGRKAAKGQGHG